MARFSRMEVYNTVLEVGLVPLFYPGDLEVCKNVAQAFLAGGSRILEFTNRGDFAPQVFLGLSQFIQENKIPLVLGVGSVVDAPTAAMYIAYGANFIVAPNLNHG